MKKLIFLVIAITLLLISPALAVDLKHGESHDFTLTATIPADPSLSHQHLSIDFVGDGLGAVLDTQVPAIDPLGNYEFHYVYTHVVPENIEIGLHALNATVTSVDEAGNESLPASATVEVNIIPSGDTTPPDAPVGLQFVEP